MTQTPSTDALLDDALAAIREAMARMDHRHDPPASAADGAPAPRHGDAAPPGGSAEQTAIHHYLVSASLLLDASLLLINQPAHLSPFERARHWAMLIEQTKTAGRMVYGAALALADPGAPKAASTSLRA